MANPEFQVHEEKLLAILSPPIAGKFSKVLQFGGGGRQFSRPTFFDRSFLGKRHHGFNEPNVRATTSNVRFAPSQECYSRTIVFDGGLGGYIAITT